MTAQRRPAIPDSSIQTFFLRPQREYTYAAVRSLFSEEFADYAVSASIPGTPNETAVLSWKDVAYQVLAQVPAASLEGALGPDANLLPAGYRTEIVTMRLPRHVIADLKEKARNGDIATDIENQYGRGCEPGEPWRPRLAETGKVVMVTTPEAVS
jgi:hypothetical protein